MHLSMKGIYYLLLLSFLVCNNCIAQTENSAEKTEKLFNLNMIVKQSDPTYVKPVNIQVNGNKGYAKVFDGQVEKTFNIKLPLGEIYSVKINAEGYASKSVIFNLADHLEEIEKLSKGRLSYNITILLLKIAELPEQVSAEVNQNDPIALIKYIPAKKQLEYDEEYSKNLTEKIRKGYKKSNLLYDNPELLKDFSAINDSLKYKQLLLLKKNEEMLKDKLALSLISHQNDSLEKEKLKREALLQKEKLLVLEKQGMFEAEEQRRLLKEKENTTLLLSQKLERDKFIFEQALKEKEIQKQQEVNKLQQIDLELADKDKRNVELQLGNERLIRNGLFGFAMLIVAVSLILLLAYRNKQKSNKILEAKNKLISDQKQEILDSIEYAKRIQSSILPPVKLVQQYLNDSFILFLPKDIVAGDFYWMEIKNEWVIFAACDCTGHGVPGALVSVVCHNALNRAVNEFGKVYPHDILDKVAELVQENFNNEHEVQDGMDASVCALNTKTEELFWSGANNPLWLIREKNLMEFKPDKQPIGKYDKRMPFSMNKIEAQKGDLIYLFTDGYADQFGGEKERKLTKAKFKDLLIAISVESLPIQKEKLLKFHENYKGKLEQIDDILIIGLKV